MQTLQERLTRLLECPETTSQSLPDLGLYMDQLLSLVNRQATNNDDLLTRTMVNNYTKDGVLARSQQKKYHRYHILLLLMLSKLKQVLSIQEIKALFNPVLRNIDSPHDDILPLEEVYDLFTELKAADLQAFCDEAQASSRRLTERLTHIEDDESKLALERFLTVLLLAAQAEFARRAAKELIADYFMEKPESGVEQE